MGIMSDTAIRVNGLGKLYQIGAAREKGDGLRHALEGTVRKWGNRLRGRATPPEPTQEDFWALKDVSFEIKRGECVGVIGRNGAGKSTLLKLLSRITEPTEGEIGLKGRVGSLLEVGTGFHPELTGRENIFLNGSVLGMGRREIQAKFDEIVAFSEVEKFLDTPVKRYSSGMYVRLAFSVAAHLEPDILIVDEVLAVGDMAFQARCYAFFAKLVQSGVSILLVTHNLLALKDYCRRGILLVDGRKVDDGPVHFVLQAYKKIMEARIPVSRDIGDGRIYIEGIELNGLPAVNGVPLDAGKQAVFVIYIVVELQTLEVYCNLTLATPDGQQLIHLRNDVTGPLYDLSVGRHIVSVTLANVPLAAGVYSAQARIVSQNIATPVLYDSEPFLIEVSNNNLPSSLVCPYHFFQHTTVGKCA